MRRILYLLFRLVIATTVIYFGWKYYPELSNVLRRTAENLVELSGGSRGIAEKIDAIIFQDFTEGISGDCRLPIAYSLGEIDSRFGASYEELLAAALKAEQLWERSAEKNVFEYSNRGIPINLVYDERQEETDRLKSSLSEIEDRKERYDFLRSEYESLSAKAVSAKDSFESLKTYYEALSAEFSEKAAAFERSRLNYEKEVKEWNEKGGAPDTEYKRLSVESDFLRRRSIELNAELEKIKKAYEEIELVRNSFNSLVNRVNAAAALVNASVSSLNERVIEYNHLAGSREEFVTGFYRESAGVRLIEVFQFGSLDELALIIAHELGHAAGIGHAKSNDSLMYPKTIPGLTAASLEDISLLNAACRLD